MGSNEVAGKHYIFIKNSQMASIIAIFTSTHHTKQLNPLPSSSTNGMVNCSWLSACLKEMKPFEDQSSTSGHLMSLKNKLQQKQPGQLSASILAELLINNYSYHLMVKSVSCCCVCGKRLFSDLVTYE